ncbi:MAG: hypothetical protein ACQETK_06095 [Pseudomonadota bacterium]
MRADSLPDCSRLVGLPLLEGANGPELDGIPVQCLMLPAGPGATLENALRTAAANSLGPRAVLHAGAADPERERHGLVLERGDPLPADFLDVATLEALGERAAYWQQCHSAAGLPESDGYRRGVLQQQIREQAEYLVERMDGGARELLEAELRYQGLYRFEDLPLAGSYWHGARAYAQGPGLGDLRVPPAPVPAFWQLVRIVLGVAVDAAGVPRADAYHAVLAGYHRQRALVPVERGAAPTLLRLAALADWLEQLEAGGDGVAERVRLQGLQAHADRLQAVWVRAAA